MWNSYDHNIKKSDYSKCGFHVSRDTYRTLSSQQSIIDILLLLEQNCTFQIWLF